MAGIMTTRARRLRKDMTDAEKRLWKHLRVLNQEGYHFRRQAPIGPYIADFIEHARKLVIECDGDQHAQGTGPARDAQRDAWFSAEGFNVLRLSNHEILANTEGVMITIIERCGVHFGTIETPSAPSPLVGEGRGGGDSRNGSESPPPCPSPTRGEGTQAARPLSSLEQLGNPLARGGRKSPPLSTTSASRNTDRGNGSTT